MSRIKSPFKKEDLRQDLKKRMSLVIDIACYVDDHLILLREQVSQLTACVERLDPILPRELDSLIKLIVVMLLQFSALISGNIYKCAPQLYLRSDSYFRFNPPDEDIVEKRKKDKHFDASYLTKVCAESCLLLQSKIKKIKSTKSNKFTKDELKVLRLSSSLIILISLLYTYNRLLKARLDIINERM
jgi:hypothetical protein